MRRGSTSDNMGMVVSDITPSLLTVESAQDAIGTILLDTATVDLVYDDATPTVSANVIPGGIPLSSLGSPVASVQFAQQQALQFVLENRTSDPGAPVTGQVWIRTDL